MLQIYFGTDISAVRKAAWSAIQAAGGTPESTQEVSSDTYQPGQLASIVGGSSLFGGQQVVLIDTPTNELADELPPYLAAMATAADTYIIIEGPLLAAAKKAYTKHTSELHEFTESKTERFNTFALAEALARRDKKQLWLLWQQARQAGVTPEEAIGVLWWQLKSIRIAASTATATEAGMKDFPYRKAKQALGTLPLAEAERLSRELLTMYHDGHVGETDLTLALEQWVLTL